MGGRAADGEHCTVGGPAQSVQHVYVYTCTSCMQVGRQVSIDGWTDRPPRGKTSLYVMYPSLSESRMSNSSFSRSTGVPFSMRCRPAHE